jgi:prepilin-type N-terminal cleavage/methylation domain-containing protein
MFSVSNKAPSGGVSGGGAFHGGPSSGGLEREGRFPRQAGFTLLELMIALGISALLLAILYQTFSSTIQTTESVDADTEIYRIAQIGFSIMSEELQSAFWSQDRANTFFTGTEDSLRYTSLSRSRYGEGIRGPELAALYYYLESPAEGQEEDTGKVLMHEEEPNLLSLSSKSLEKGELAERVESFKLRYRGKRNWAESWDTSDRNGLPQAVELKLVLKGKRDREYEFLTQVAIPISR